MVLENIIVGYIKHFNKNKKSDLLLLAYPPTTKNYSLNILVAIDINLSYEILLVTLPAGANNSLWIKAFSPYKLIFNSKNNIDLLNILAHILY